MTQRSPDLSDLPRMVPDRDDIVRHRDNGGGPPTEPPSPNGGRAGRPRVWPLYCLLLILAGGLGFTWYEFYNAREALRTTSASLSDARNRVSELEGQLSDTDESLSLNANAIQANFNNILGEIRSLWDVADRRNRDWIRENQTALEPLSDLPEELSALSDQLTSVESELGSFGNAINELSGSVRDNQSAVSALSNRADTLANQAAEQSDTLGQLVANQESLFSRLDEASARADSAADATADNNQQLNTVEGNLISLRAQLENEAALRADLGKTVSALSDDVTAMGGRAGNQELSELTQRVDNIDNARSDTIQRLSNLQAQIAGLRERLQSTEQSVEQVQDVEVVE